MTPARRLSSLLFLVALSVAASCASEATPGVDPATYRTELAAICTASNAERTALVRPTDDAGVAGFARSVADVLEREAESARAVQAPADLDADHRAFIQNTADQAARWTTLATTATDDTELFGTLQTEILQLTLGRDDLATAMDVPACRVSAS